MYSKNPTHNVYGLNFWAGDSFVDLSRAEAAIKCVYSVDIIIIRLPG